MESITNFFQLCTAFTWLSVVHGKKVDNLKDVLEVLMRKSLLENFGGWPTIFGMHDLWREFAVAEAEKFKNQCRVYKAQECNNILTWNNLLNVVVMKLVDVPDLVLNLSGLKHLKSLEVILEHPSVLLEVNGLGTLESLIFMSFPNVASFDGIAERGCLTKLEVVELLGYKGDKLPDIKIGHYWMYVVASIARFE